MEELELAVEESVCQAVETLDDGVPENIFNTCNTSFNSLLKRDAKIRVN